MKTHTSLSRRNQIATLSAAGAAAAGLSCAPSAQAAVLYTDIADLTCSPSGTSTIFFDLDNSSGGPLFASPTTFSGYDFRLSFYPGIFSATEKPAINGSLSGYILADGAFAGKLASGSPIGAASTFARTLDLDVSAGAAGALPGGPWDGTVGDAYLGLRLDAGGGSFKYGWARIDYNDAANTLTLKDFALEQSLNTTINAGSTVPEPSHGLLLALGLGGAALRRSRKAA